MRKHFGASLSAARRSFIPASASSFPTSRGRERCTSEAASRDAVRTDPERGNAFGRRKESEEFSLESIVRPLDAAVDALRQLVVTPTALARARRFAKATTRWSRFEQSARNVLTMGRNLARRKSSSRETSELVVASHGRTTSQLVLDVAPVSRASKPGSTCCVCSGPRHRHREDRRRYDLSDVDAPRLSAETRR